MWDFWHFLRIFLLIRGDMIVKVPSKGVTEQCITRARKNAGYREAILVHTKIMKIHDEYFNTISNAVKARQGEFIFSHSLF